MVENDFVEKEASARTTSAPGAACSPFVLLFRDYSQTPGGAFSALFSLQAEVLVQSCASFLRQQRLLQQHH